MSQVTEQTIKKDNYSIHLIDTKKFKTNTIALKFTRPLKRENITERALLPFVLQKGTEKYPTERALRQQLDELYGAKFSIYGAKKVKITLLLLYWTYQMKNSLKMKRR